MTDIWILIFAGLALVHACYGLVFAWGISRTPTLSSHEEPVSIVIAAKNEEKNLLACLPGILQQSYANFEVIVVVNQTTDNSLDVLENLSLEYPNLQVLVADTIPKDVHPKKHAIKLGIEQAKNDAILLTDADCSPKSAHWISEMVKGFKYHQVVIGYAPYQKTSGWVSALTQFETMLTGIQYVSFANLGQPYMGVGRNMGYRKSFFKKSRGFEGYEGVTGGDDDLFVHKNANSNNAIVQLAKTSFVASMPEKNMRAYIHQKIRHLSVGKQYSWRLSVLLGIFTLTHIVLWLGLLLAIFTNTVTAIAVLFIFSYLPFLFSFYLFGRKTIGGLQAMMIVLVDVVFTIFYIFVGIQAMFTKRIEWTN
jgi:glycosyltransferase involved in cell wall biosynthesis